jgi:hypothetical protein
LLSIYEDFDLQCGDKGNWRGNGTTVVTAIEIRLVVEKGPI